MVDYVKQDMALIWAELGDYVAPANDKITTGWLVEVPPRQYWNWIENRQDKMLAYLSQKGIPEWDNTTEYVINRSYVQHNGVVYRCIRTNTGVTPGTSALDWVIAFTTSTTASEALKEITVAADRLPYFNSSTTATTTVLTSFARSILDDVDASAVRTTINAQQSNANLTAISGLTSAANKLPYFTGNGTAATTDLTSFGRSLIDDADAAAARLTLGLGSIATQNSNSITVTGGSISGASISGSSFSGGSISGLSSALSIADGGTGATTASVARTNLGLGSIATQNSTSVNITGGTITGITDLTIADGGTGASTAEQARVNLDVYSKADVYTKTETYSRAEVEAIAADEALINAIIFG